MSDRGNLTIYAEEGNVAKIRELFDRYSFDQQMISKALWNTLTSPNFSRSSSHMECVKLLLPMSSPNFKSNNATTYLMRAVKIGNYELVLMLLAQGCNASAFDRDKKSVLMHALEVDGDDPVQIVSLLLSHEARINDADNQGFTPLHVAAKRGFVDSLRELATHGADLDAKNNNSDTPLHLAVRSNCKACAETLVQRGANPKIRNLMNKTAIDEASGGVLACLTGSKEDIGFSRGRGKGRGRARNYRKKENNGRFNEQNDSFLNQVGCAKCKIPGATYCLECAEGFISQGLPKSLAQKSMLEEENKALTLEIERLKKDIKKKDEKIQKLKGKKAEIGDLGHPANKEDIDKNIENGLYSVKLARSQNSALFIKDMQQMTLELVLRSLQQEIDKFLFDLNTWGRKVEGSYVNIIEIFSNIIKEEFPKSEVRVYGSYATGLLLPYSDIDLVIQNADHHSSRVLQSLAPKLESQPIVKEIEKILTASIPVLKVSGILDSKNIRVDISVQDSRHKGIVCAQYVKNIVGQYTTIKPVFLLLKQLIFFSNFHEPFKGGLSSYGLLLMIAWFFQEQTEEWQRDYANNLQNVADIFIRVLYFYAWEFDYLRFIAVKGPEKQTRETWPIVSQGLYILDPLNPQCNITHSVNLSRLMNIFQIAYSNIWKPALCSCQSCQSILERIYYEAKFSAM